MCVHAIIPSIKCTLVAAFRSKNKKGYPVLYLCQKLTIYILKSKQCLGCFCWVSQKVENSLVSQRSIALDVYFCACISCNNIVINAEILLLLGTSRHIFKSHRRHEIHRLFFVLNRWVLPIHLTNKIRFFLSNL